MLKATVLLALVASSNACCGLAFTTCCQAYAPPRIIGYERIPLYAKLPVQAAPPPPSYAVAPPVMQAPPMPIQEISAPLPQQPMFMQQPSYFAGPQTVMVQEQPRPVVQPVIVQETPSYQPQPVVVQEMPTAVQTIQSLPARVSQVAVPVQSSYAQPGAVGIAQPTVVQPVMSNGVGTNAVDFNGPLQVPTARALKLRRQYLKQVKV